MTTRSLLTASLEGGFAITPDDANDLPAVTRQIRVTGDAGDVAVVWLSGVETIEPVEAGGVYDWRIKRVKDTGTDATGLRGYY